jgi:hypothetical protein
MTNKICKNCKWFKLNPLPNVPPRYEGECMYNPPISLNDSIRPFTHLQDWCKKWDYINEE